jgi:SAM-dependent methyltransferase
VRVWSREAYEKVGGHNPDMSVADDHDLVCRTYLAGFDFKHIGGCGYLYRYHPDNTVKKRGDKIAELQNANRRMYTAPLAKEWSRRNKLEVVELHKLLKDGKWLPGTKLPFEDDSVGQVVAWDCLQFCPPDTQVAVFNEMFRVLAPAGVLNLSVPGPRGRYAIQDPRHLTHFNENSFLYYTVREFAEANSAIDCRFQLIQAYTGFPSETYKKHDMQVLFVDLCALKGQRQPGPQNI